MVTVIFEPGCVRASGHGQDEAGCAVVSALLYALAGWLENLYTPPPAWFIETGRAFIPYPAEDAGAAFLAQLCETALRQVAAVREDVRIIGLEENRPEGRSE